MKLQLVPARQGIRWVRQGFAIFVRQPMGFAGLFASFLFIVFVLTLLPVVGPVLLLGLLPLGSLGFMIATRHALDGRFPLPPVFVEPLRTGRPKLLSIVKLGLLYAAATGSILWVCDLIDGGALDALMEAQASAKSTPDVIAARLADPRLEIGVLLRFCLLGLLSVPYWHAPALVHWGGLGFGKALFFSTVACWRNKGAFLVFSLTWFAVLMIFAMLANLLFGIFGRAQLVPFVAMPASLVFSTVFYASLYFTFQDCFAPEDVERDNPLDGARPAV
ncbi:MAG: BPSS1780 family membrane protein [Caldimonas sp.]